MIHLIKGALREYFEANTESMVNSVLELVRLESPSSAPPAVQRAIDLLARWLTEEGASIQRFSGGDYANPVAAHFGGEGPSSVVLIHVDTVWPIGELAKRPPHRSGNRIYGPGIYDMKAGAALAYWAIKGLRELKFGFSSPCTILVTGDEEIGSPASGGIIEDICRHATRVLVPEPGDITGAVKTRRKGWGRYEIAVSGRASHAGANHQDGRSAIYELARHIVSLESLTDYGSGTTVNVGLIRGGTAANVVPAEAVASIDTRFWTREEAVKIDALIKNLKSLTEGVSLKVSGGINRWPIEKTPANERLYQQAVECASRLGFELPETSNGGVSDGNISSALGVATLDGLGAVGAGAHAVDEYIETDSLARRAALMASLLLLD